MIIFFLFRFCLDFRVFNKVSKDCQFLTLISNDRSLRSRGNRFSIFLIKYDFLWLGPVFACSGSLKNDKGTETKN